MTTPDQHAPTHGFTKFAQAVHKRTVDHLPARTAYQRFNKRVALALTRYVGTMTCFWIFCLLALCSLPAVHSGFSVFSGVFPAVIIKASIIALVAWVAQTLIQLVVMPALLPAIMVGQSLQNARNDARAAKQFEDAEETRADVKVTLDLLDIHTEGGLADVLAEAKAIRTAVEKIKTPPG